MPRLLLPLLLLSLYIPVSVSAQVPQTNYTSLQYDRGPVTPGSCTMPAFFFNTTTGTLTTCDASGHFNDAAGAPITQWGGQYQATATSTQVSPYNHTVTAQATGNTGTTFGFVNHWNDLAWVQEGTNYAIRQTGLIKSVTFSWGNPGPSGNQYTHLYFILCRPSVSMTAWNQIAGDCPVVVKSEDILAQAQAGAGGIVTVTFAQPLAAKKGDFYGFESQGTFNGSAPTNGHADDRFFAEAANCGSTSHCYIATTVSNSGIQPLTNAWNLTWTTNSSSTGIGTDNAIPVQITMAQAPVFVAIGDSIIAGNTRNPGLITNVGGASAPNVPDPTSQIAYWMSQATGWTYQSMGVGGQTTAQIQARFATDCIQLKPQFCLIEGGVNDVAQSISAATTEANWTSILTAAQAANIKPVCLLITPWTGGTNTQAGQVDTLNTWLNGRCELYGGVTVDARPYVGQFRTGGATDNLWDIRPEYVSTADNLRIHFSTLGYQVIARAILDKLGVTTFNPVARKNGVYYSKTQLLNASVGSTTANCTTDYAWAPATCEHGLYRLSVYMSPMTTAAASTVTLSFTYKDAKDPVGGTGGNTYTLTTSSLDLSSAANNLQASYVLTLDGLTAPTWSTTYSGTATYQVYVALERID